MRISLKKHTIRELSSHWLKYFAEDRWEREGSCEFEFRSDSDGVGWDWDIHSPRANGTTGGVTRRKLDAPVQLRTGSIKRAR